MKLIGNVLISVAVIMVFGPLILRILGADPTTSWPVGQQINLFGAALIIELLGMHFWNRATQNDPDNPTNWS